MSKNLSDPARLQSAKDTPTWVHDSEALFAAARGVNISMSEAHDRAIAMAKDSALKHLTEDHGVGLDSLRTITQGNKSPSVAPPAMDKVIDPNQINHNKGQGIE